MTGKKYDVKPEHHRLWVQKDTSVTLSTNIGDGFPDDFIITDDRSRILYLAAQINSNLPPQISNKERKMILEDSLNEYLPDMNYIEFVVDSDSTWLIPKLKDHNYPPHRYIDTIRSTLIDKQVIITSNSVPDDLRSLLIEFHDLDDILIDSYGFYCIEDEDNYLLYNKTTGETIKLDSTLHKSDFPVIHPHFIDLLITNKCGNACLYCSRDCTPNGLVSSLKNVKKSILAFQNMDISEVLISGGDLYSYPEFKGLIEFLRKEKDKTDIVFNTSLPIRSIELRGREIFKRIEDLMSVCSTFSFPIDYARGVREFIELYKRMFDTSNIRYSLRIMPEMMFRNQRELFESVQICKYFGVPITLTGFREVGRGRNTISIRTSQNSKQNIEDMFAILFGNGKPNYYIDDKFLKDFPGIKEYLPNWKNIMSKRQSTCTVDLVNRCISRYSYSEKKIPLNMDGGIQKQVEEAFPNLS